MLFVFPSIFFWRTLSLTYFFWNKMQHTYILTLLTLFFVRMFFKVDGWWPTIDNWHLTHKIFEIVFYTSKLYCRLYTIFLKNRCPMSFTLFSKVVRSLCSKGKRFLLPLSYTFPEKCHSLSSRFFLLLHSYTSLKTVHSLSSKIFINTHMPLKERKRYRLFHRSYTFWKLFVHCLQMEISTITHIPFFFRKLFIRCLLKKKIFLLPLTLYLEGCHSLLFVHCF